jgi:hypothetical protein
MNSAFVYVIADATAHAAAHLGAVADAIVYVNATACASAVVVVSDCVDAHALANVFLERMPA